jgi:hypothetical protein
MQKIEMPTLAAKLAEIELFIHDLHVMKIAAKVARHRIRYALIQKALAFAESDLTLHKQKMGL